MNLAPPSPRTGARILVDALLGHGVTRAFGVPGESYLAVLDALYDVEDRLDFVVCRHEAGAVNMAEADGKLTHAPGIAFVTRGPGALHGAIGLHTAFQDSTPLILFIGQVARGMREREAFQELDYRRVFGQMAKWVAEIDSADRIPEFVSRAFHTATSGRPGPVVLALPEDMLDEKATVADLPAYRPLQPHPAPADMASLRSLLAQATRPLLLVGGGGWDGAARAAITAFAEANALPVACAWRRQDAFDNRHGNYAGDVGIGINPALAERVRAADLLIVAGPRLGEMTTGGYTLIQAPAPTQRLVHVHPGAEELNRVYRADLAILSGMAAFAEAARALLPVDSTAWAAQTAQANAAYRASLALPDVPGALNPAACIRAMDAALPADAILCNGAGNYAAWLHRFHQYGEEGTQLAPTSGAMGYGVPAAIAAKLRHPGRIVVSWNGDGCFLMTGQELATAAARGLAIVFVVLDNGIYGTIRMHQEREYPGRVYGTALANPDFAALARAYGLEGERVERSEDFPAAFARALAAPRGALLHLIQDPDAITPRTTLSALRRAAAGR